eukprot:CAMPEP_0204532544 /NCGR_PEP_ID=MMETSP0661-20131031/11780_1 /ASSEMBLY_ACC=CAM_ASM_000606 /TAXON_ID=109239 /ORGANISM="Alexandrium margalefi, Strain AMGDE01CS-322" /LENGTH=417 /DNA_ID=CAMNT_0051538795 /DNA_START=85 /DNA_END=1338 /DNA_ORIENTATION=+
MAAAFVEMLGEKLLGPEGEVPTAEALAGKEAVAFYFSAHWCPPCRGFTPKLAEWYKADLAGKGLEVVFVSSDRDEDAFKEYFGEQPWKALPYSDRAKKEALSKKFKVNGIPSLVILDAEGKTITKDGRSAVSADPKGEEFPWKPKTLKDILADAKFIGKEGPVDNSALDGKVLAFYFSAHWCPPCRGFTPQLAKWYTDGLKDKNFQVVFVSSDRDEDAFKEYYGEQPWLALDYACRKTKEQLSNLYGVNGIPSLVLVDTDGSTITTEGRGAVSKDPTGAEFPWYPKPVADLEDGPGNLNEAAVVVALCESAGEEAQKAAEAAMTPLAKASMDEAKAKGEETPELSFMIAKEDDGISQQIRKMTGLDGAKAAPKLIIINIPDDGAFYLGPDGEITEAVVQKFAQDFKAGSLERKQLEK